MRQIFLGQGPRDEVGKGLVGNTILLSQAEVTPTHILPAVNKALDSFSIVFCRSVEDVRHCKALTVNKSEYLECLKIRKKICPIFSSVHIDMDAADKDLPENGVPRAFVEAAVSLPEAESLHTVMPGPASRGDPLGEKEFNEEDEEGSSEETQDLAVAGSLDKTPDTIIGIDFMQDPKPVQHFEAMRAKLEMLNREGQRLQQSRCSQTMKMSQQPQVRKSIARELFWMYSMK